MVKRIIIEMSDLVIIFFWGVMIEMMCDVYTCYYFSCGNWVKCLCLK